MEGSIMELSRNQPLESRGLLYPLMVIAAIAVIVFSVLGMATIMGWMPSALTKVNTGAGYAGDAPGVTFECAECGILESMRDPAIREDRSGPRKIVASIQS
jgi:hypothetical protein